MFMPLFPFPFPASCSRGHKNVATAANTVYNLFFLIWVYAISRAVLKLILLANNEKHRIIVSELHFFTPQYVIGIRWALRLLI
jgi:hypothetical protein